MVCCELNRSTRVKQSKGNLQLHVSQPLGVCAMLYWCDGNPGNGSSGCSGSGAKLASKSTKTIPPSDAVGLAAAAHGPTRFEAFHFVGATTSPRKLLVFARDGLEQVAASSWNACQLPHVPRCKSPTLRDAVRESHVAGIFPSRVDDTTAGFLGQERGTRSKSTSTATLATPATRLVFLTCRKIKQADDRQTTRRSTAFYAEWPTDPPAKPS